MGLRLAPPVLDDFDSIFLTGAESFGLAAADEYLDQLQRRLEVLASEPLAGRERPEIVPPVRLMRFRAHHILYRTGNDEVVVLRILHGRANWLDHL